MIRPISENRNCQAAAYLSRPPEGLTVNGYRHFVAGFMTHDHACFEICEQNFIDLLGKHNGVIASQLLGHVVEKVGHCALCPLKCYAPNTQHLGSDECMLLGLIAAIQHGDDDALNTSIAALTCPQNYHKIISPAGEYAAIMKACGSLLLPIPAHVLSDIQSKAHQPDIHSKHTLH